MQASSSWCLVAPPSRPSGRVLRHPDPPVRFHAGWTSHCYFPSLTAWVQYAAPTQLHYLRGGEPHESLELHRWDPSDTTAGGAHAISRERGDVRQQRSTLEPARVGRHGGTSAEATPGDDLEAHDRGSPRHYRRAGAATGHSAATSAQYHSFATRPVTAAAVSPAATRASRWNA